MFILSSPSGAGKTTIARKLLANDSRAPRLGLGHHAARCAPVRWTGRTTTSSIRRASTKWWSRTPSSNGPRVFGHSYGTPKGEIRAGLKQGLDYLFDIDWQGTQQLYQKAQADVVRVFILPPSLEELSRRLVGRGTDSAEVIAARMARAQAEISHWDGYDYVVINDDVDVCFQKVREILAAERMRRTRQTGLIDFVRELTRG